MKLLFVHQNFPGQFRHLSSALVDRGYDVRALCPPGAPIHDDRIRAHNYSLDRGTAPGVHPWVMDLESKTIRAEACFLAAHTLKKEGYYPDKIIAHPGWGESHFLKEVWPRARLAAYCEFYYHAHGLDVGFDPEFPRRDLADGCRMQLKNLNNVLALQNADAAISPTCWQASTFPPAMKQKISIIHDGIPSHLITPNQDVSISLNKALKLTKRDEIVTFVNRNLEPYRGYHIFMRCLPKLLRERPKARVVVVGGEGVSYGQPPDPKLYEEATWKKIYIDEVRPSIPDDDWQRVHFVGNVSHEVFVSLMQLSTVHVYLTYPFVLSWSLLEAMSAGACIVAGDTAPVREVIQNEDTGMLVDFFDHEGIADAVAARLDSEQERTALGSRARDLIKSTYDLRDICLPKQINWAELI